MIIRGTTDFGLSDEQLPKTGVCEVCGTDCAEGYTLCHRCALKRRDLRKKFRQIIIARREQFDGGGAQAARQAVIDPIFERSTVKDLPVGAGLFCFPIEMAEKPA